MRRIIASLDIGSNTIKLIIGEIFKKRLNVLAVNEVPAQGIKKGVVINPDLTTVALKELFQNTRRLLDLEIKEVIINVPSYNLETMIVGADNTITGENNVVTSSDIVRVLQSAVYNKVSDTREIVNISPITFKVDELVTKTPIGTTGNKLSVKAVVASVPKKQVYGIIGVLEKIGVEVIDLTVSGMADYFTYRSDKTDNACGAIINIGSDTTTLSILNKGILTASDVLDVGGASVDNDISYVYKISRSESKRVKEHLGLASSKLAVPNDNMIIANKYDENVTINQYDVSEVIASRLLEILNNAKKQINLLTKKDISYIIITGGLTEIKDFKLILEEVFGSKVILGTINELGVRNNKYSVSLGLVRYFDYKLKMKDKEYSLFDEEALKELNKKHKGNASGGSIIDKLFGYFFDN